MIGKSKWFSAAVAVGLLAALPARADERTGMIDICREPGMTSASDRLNIEIAAGTHFVDTGMMDRRRDDGVTLPVTFVTDSSASLKVGQRCVRVPAKATVGRPGLTVAPGNGRHYGYSGTPGSDRNLQALMSLMAAPASAFR